MNSLKFMLLEKSLLRRTAGQVIYNFKMVSIRKGASYRD